MKPPAFWSNPPERPGFAARLLAPAGALYARATANSIAKAAPFDPGVPVVCVGNATLGGVGKTPFARLAMSLLQADGIDGWFLSRGYGGREAGPVRVDPGRHSAADVGDEPLMLAATAPCLVARDRADGARAAVEAGARAIIMDDGFQNPSLKKTLSLLLVDGTAAFGNGRVFPAGPLREPAETAAARADALVVVAAGPTSPVAAALEGFAPHPPRLKAWLEPDSPAPERVFAFCGIGRPEKFFETLRAAGYEVAGARGFADHRPYTDADLDALRADAAATGARLITTEKDAARLGGRLPEAAVLNVAMRVDDETALRGLLRRATGFDAPGDRR
ncbi:MAG: tetraacyldisaccharide 4'-kinase [Pseudomonadota bacterium]